MKIKVCGMKIPANIAAVSAMNIDYMGFIFYAPSPRYVSNTLDTNILENTKIKGVGVFVNEAIEKVQFTQTQNNLQYVQLHGDESPDYCQKMKAAGFVVTKAFPVNDDFDFIQLKNYLAACDYFLFDTKGKTHGGTGKKFNWNILQQYTYEKPFFLSGGIGPEDVESVLAFQHPQLHALDLNSKFEIAPGGKNVQSLEQFLNKLNFLNS